MNKKLAIGLASTAVLILGALGFAFAKRRKSEDNTGFVDNMPRITDTELNPFIKFAKVFRPVVKQKIEDNTINKEILLTSNESITLKSTIDVASGNLYRPTVVWLVNGERKDGQQTITTQKGVDTITTTLNIPYIGQKSIVKLSYIVPTGIDDEGQPTSTTQFDGGTVSILPSKQEAINQTITRDAWESFGWVGGQNIGGKSMSGLHIFNGNDGKFKVGDFVEVLVKKGDTSYNGFHRVAKLGTDDDAKYPEYINTMITLDTPKKGQAEGLVRRASGTFVASNNGQVVQLGTDNPVVSGGGESVTITLGADGINYKF